MKTLVACLLVAVSLGAADFAGKWTGTVEIPAGVFQVTLTLEQKGEQITGSIATGNDVYPVLKGKLAGDSLSFEVSADQIYQVECVLDSGRIMGNIKPSGGGAGKINVERAK